jgi:hypothetical protein
MLSFLPVWLLCLVLTLQAADPAPPASAKPQVRFNSYDIDPKSNDVMVALTFLSGKQRTLFIPVGGKIPDSTWVLKSFQQKKQPGPDGKEMDTSELTLADSVTGETMVVKRAHVIESGPPR